ncbi:hypothetical protein GLOIN_2v1778000 [Rhizophagus irregularis DAOM 181602=DAOM 197198]|uniref:Uncharacterized protein n=1 Tax=Rhizophagus irregularis (strain DAOM 181602 / DAOM 197198 / MUCL 43194) TaxID=747089 RepID=A0A2P4PTB9_RHIID|nr:hypothetical protein GLOIN_2v1778000 [Rhizophagus irregularis DAOM 181602=DAOM 197198]POG68631.1 hypothetical protein GLOIN_2v1778000 [Rhizophagus irregularis DAOM 181602=DAOM 197198]|eukprot:XP_025175497.1 hypothetical protein GLOIN_2v1778000 [Rhizophagus irregularis DAOM 181602=DAOM 197198]
MLTIITNNRHIVKKYDKFFKVNSDRAIMNTKYKISKYLTSVFCGLPIKLETRNMYYSRIHLIVMSEYGIWDFISHALIVVMSVLILCQEIEKYAKLVVQSSSHEKNKKNIKKRFFNSLKNNKNKWQDTSNGFDSKIYISKHRLKQIFVKHSFNKEYFFELRRKKEALFDLEDNIVTEQSISSSEGVTIDKVTEDLKVLEIREQINLAP